jgi:Fur family zinc uptake transcriptional regulator
MVGQQASRALTRNQTLVLNALARTEAPLSAYTLLDQLREEGLRAPLQVYRALDKLVEYGLVHRLESLNSFVACAHSHHHGHGMAAFAICEKCGQVEEFSDEAVEERLGAWAVARGFRPAKTTIELRGLCGSCA